jgi:hypothetical protein
MMAGVTEHIRAHTYPEWGNDAAALHGRILEQVMALPDEELDFGEVALDIGGRDGRFAPVIRALGPSFVVTIDPLAAEVEKGVSAGLVSPYAAWTGTLEDWAKEGREPAGSAFIFGMQPHLANAKDFMQSIPRAVRVGGLVVTSCAEPTTAFSFWNVTNRYKWTGLQLLRPAEELPKADGRDAYLHIWRRIAAQDMRQ